VDRASYRYEEKLVATRIVSELVKLARLKLHGEAVDVKGYSFELLLSSVKGQGDYTWQDTPK